MVHVENTLEYSRPSCRWAVDISGWNPSDEEFEFLCHHLIKIDEGLHCRRFKFLDDRKRALVSVLLQRLVGALVLKKGNTSTTRPDKTVDPRKIDIGKTKGRKPYIDTTKEPFENEDTVNFNYNVSHDGNFVVLAAETHCVCGCDISSTGSLFRKRGSTRAMEDSISLEECKKFFTAFEKQLTTNEWERVYGEPGDSVQSICDRFCTYWSLKEAFAKAIGMGLGYDLGQVEFEVDEHAGMAFARIHPETDISPDWCLYIHHLSDGHWVSVARGPPHAIIDAHGGFKNTFRSPELPRDVLNAHVFQNREPTFVQVDAQSLIDTYCRCIDSPDTLREEYLKRFGRHVSTREGFDQM